MSSAVHQPNPMQGLLKKSSCETLILQRRCIAQPRWEKRFEKANGRKLRQENDRHDADVRGERRNAGMCLPGPRDGPGFAGPGLT
jgi:hypothetical protein